MQIRLLWRHGEVLRKFGLVTESLTTRPMVVENLPEEPKRAGTDIIFMYAVVVKLAIDPAHAPAAAAVFTTRILSKITSMEGFSSGQWLDPSSGEGLG